MLLAPRFSPTQLLVTLPFLSALLAIAAPAPTGSHPGISQAAVVEKYGKLPLVFEPNRGQAGSAVQYIARTPGYTLLLGHSEAVMRLNGGGEVRMNWVGASVSDSRPDGIERLPGVSNYFVGADSKNWVTDVPQFGRVRYSEVYPGIDLVYYGNQQQLEYDFVVRAGANPDQIQMSFAGADGISVDARGDLMIRVKGGKALTQQKPIVYQEVDGQRVQIASHYLVGSNGRDVRVILGEYDRMKEVVIDPTLVYSTYFGDAGNDGLGGIAVDASGNLYLTGTLSSELGIIFNGSYVSCLSPDYCAWVAKLNASGTQLQYFTYLGGSHGKVAGSAGIAVDSQGNAYVTGNAVADFPSTPGAYKPFTSANGGSYLAKLASNTGALVYATTLDDHNSGSAICYNTQYPAFTSCPAANPVSLAVDPWGNAYVTGFINSSSYKGSHVFPVYNSVQATGGGDADAFVVAINAAGTAAIYSTLLGGSDGDYPTGIAVDSYGSATIVGWTGSSQFPVTPNALQSKLKAVQNGFVTRFSASGNLEFSTYLGGTEGDPLTGGGDTAESVAVDAQGNLYIAGSTTTTDFPVTNSAFQLFPGKGFLTKLNPTGSTEIFSTFLPAGAKFVAVDAAGMIYVSGLVYSNTLPTTQGAIQSAFGGGSDTYLFQFTADGSILTYSTYLGGSDNEIPRGLAVDVNGFVYLGGTTDSKNFPTTAGVISPSALGGLDAFLTKINMAAGSCSFALGASSESVPAAGGVVSLAVTVLTGCPWTASSIDSFVTITSGTSGSGNGTVTLNVSPNNSSSARVSTLSVAGQTFIVQQAGAACAETLGSTGIVFSANGGISGVSVIAPTGCLWTSSSNATWITINAGSSGSGNGSVQYAVPANSGVSRTGTLTVAGQTFTVTQSGNGCFFTLGNTGGTAPAAGGTGSVTVTGSTSSCTWNATSGASWLTIMSGSSGTGSGSVAYTAAANPSSASRSAALSIGGQTYTITQAGASCSYSLAATGSLQGAAGGSGSVALMSAPGDCTWSAGSGASWITLTSPTSGTGSTAISFNVGVNSSSLSRTGTLTIAGQTYTLTQSGVACSYSLNPTSASSPASGGSGSTTLMATPSDCTWIATDSDSWVTIPGAGSGTGTGTVSYTTAANTSNQSRSSVINIAGLSFTINQAGVACTYMLSAPAESFSYNGGSASVNLTTGPACAYTASSSASWVTVSSGASGTGSSAIGFNVAANTTNSSRTATLTIGGQTFTITEAGQNQQYLAVVSNSGSNNVTVLELTGDTTLGSVNVGTDPRGVVLSPDGRLAYVANASSGTVSVIDPFAQSLVASITVQSQPTGIAITPDGLHLYVANYDSNTVSVIDTTTRTVIATIPVGTNPEGIAVTADGSKVYVASTGANVVTVISTSTNAPVAFINVGSNPFGIALSADSKTGYVTNYLDGSVSVLDLVNNRVTNTITVGLRPTGVALTPDGQRVFVANEGSDSLSVIDTSTNTVLNPISVGSHPRGIAVSADGSRVVVTNYQGNTVSVIDATSDLVLATPAVGTQPRSGVAIGNCTVLGSNTGTASGSGGPGTIAVNSGCNWTAASNASWLVINSGSSGSHNGTVSYLAAANTSSTTRTGTITIGGQTYTVTQSGFTPTLTISPVTISLPVSGGTGTIAVTANTATLAWTAASNASWLTITAGASGTGSGSVSYSATANTTSAPRTATLSINGQNVTITQAGAVQDSPVLTTSASTALYNNYSSFALNPKNLAVQTRTISLAASTGAVAYGSVVTPLTGSPAFVTVSPATGATPATVTLTVNPTGLTTGAYTNTVTFTSAGASTAYTVVLNIQPAVTSATGASAAAKVGIYRDSAGLFLLDRNGDGSCCAGDLIGTLGQSGDLPLSGDWTGDGVKKIGMYRPSTGLFLIDSNNDGTFDTGDKFFYFASQAGDIPVVGDWTGSGIDRVGLFRASTGTWYLDLNNDGSFTGRAYLGQSGDIPLVGNWSGVGTKVSVGIYRPTSVNGQPGNFFLVDSNGDGQYTSADSPLFFFGQPGDIPMVGDWNGDGKSKVGVVRPAGSAGGAGLMILDQNGSFSWDGPGTDKVLYFGPYLNGLTSTTTIQLGDMPVTGNWVASYGASNTVNLQGRTRVGMFRPGTGTFFLDVSGDGTFQGRAYLGQSGDVPVGVPVISNGAIVGVNMMGNF